MPIQTRTTRVISSACALPIRGCTAIDAMNYNPSANQDDGSCQWGNDPASAVYTKNDCPAGSTGSTYELFVAENEYISTQNKAHANTLRDTDMAIRGQFLANNNPNATCTPDNPEESGLVELARAEWQRAKQDGTPAMLKVKLLRTSENGVSPVGGTVELRIGAPSGTLVEVLPDFFFNQDQLCDTIQVPIGIDEGSNYYAYITIVNPANYQPTATPYQSVNRVDTFSTDMDCL